MKSFVLLLSASLLLSGCISSKNKPKIEVPISPEHQAKYLSHPIPPQQYGFPVYRVPNGINCKAQLRLHPNHLVTVDMIEGDIPVIKVQGRSRREKMNILLDFGSNVSWIEFTKSQEFKAKFLGINKKNIPYRGVYNTGGKTAFLGLITQLRIPPLFMENIPFYIRMATGALGPQARGIEQPIVDAVLGYDNLSAFEYIQIDPFDKKIRFSSSIPYVPHDELLMTTAKIVKISGFGLAVDGAIFGKPTPIVLDFAGDYAFTRGDIKVNSTKQVSLGDIVFTKVPTLVTEPHIGPPGAGRKMLNAYVITICAKKGVVYFERPPKK
jgi:hypothetical protein